MSEYGKLQKVTLQFENITISLEGKDALAWKSMADSQAVLAHVHGYKYDKLNWKEESQDGTD